MLTSDAFTPNSGAVFRGNVAEVGDGNLIRLAQYAEKASRYATLYQYVP